METLKTQKYGKMLKLDDLTKGPLSVIIEFLDFC